jgi:hypothetical protein
MRDFTVNIFKRLLNEIQQAGYDFVTFGDFLADAQKEGKTIVLRHDVDNRPVRALVTAELEKGLGIKGTYYFRVKRDEIPGEVLKKIAKLGHEIGYHYEDLGMAGGNVKDALASFQRNLARLREMVPVQTICMHGSPLSRHDSRELWKSRSYREFGIIGEPYFDIDFNKVLYLTDTGRRWDGELVSIRDKVVSSQKSVVSRREAIRRPKLHSTQDVINALKENRLPQQIMLTIHPQRWTDELLPWVGELLGQKVKNSIKYFVVRRVDNRQ